jgi:Xaa-Pro aminopeptidase
MKARKNPVEIDGTIAAHIRDGVAVTRFLSSILGQGDAAKFTELTASDLLQKFREEGENFRGLSFDTISGAGGNGAIVHYRSSPETCKPLLAGPIYLVDSGAQYFDGTTDITRTVAVDNVDAEMKDRFTRVLKGHIQVAMSVFPEGTVGKELDDKARAALKEVGLDYAHGTGHGVGSYLSVHEGPCGISPRSTTVPFEPGMIVSNEPGYYKEGAYGIRIENLVTVVDTGKTDDNGKKLLGFTTLTMAPIDRNLIEPTLLTDAELKWLNDYHAEVKATILPLVQKVDAKAAAFLEEATKPLSKGAPPQPKSLKKFCL